MHPATFSTSMLHLSQGKTFLFFAHFFTAESTASSQFEFPWKPYLHFVHISALHFLQTPLTSSLFYISIKSQPLVGHQNNKGLESTL